MFFIGIFGIQQARKTIGTYNNVPCPSCGAYTRFEVFKTFSYFHVFFIPTFRWNTRYYVQSACCGSIFELDPVIGRQYEKGQNPEIRNEHLRPIHQHVPYTTCSGCGARVDPHFRFCPFCGKERL